MSDLKPITGTSIPYLHVPGDNFLKNFYVYFIL